jgi:putative membrane protein
MGGKKPLIKNGVTIHALGAKSMMDNSMMMRNIGIWMGFGAIFWVILIASIIALIYWIIRNSGIIGQSANGESALDLLKKRYARGEITSEEFEDIKGSLLND